MTKLPECRRCGKCCHFTQKLRNEETVRTQCVHLIPDGPDQFYCSIYEDRPKTCREFTCLIQRMTIVGDDLSIEEKQEIIAEFIESQKRVANDRINDRIDE